MGDFHLSKISPRRRDFALTRFNRQRAERVFHTLGQFGRLDLHTRFASYVAKVGVACSARSVSKLPGDSMEAGDGRVFRTLGIELPEP